jgi:hypothetical protein
MKTIRSGVLLLVAAGLLAACAEERAPINRVQPYALPKSFFIGADFQGVDDDPQFWYQTTMTDVGYGATKMGLFTSTYAQPTSRIKWQITENYLIGRAAYERIEGSDGKGLATGLETQDGNIAVMYAITSHFDIVNSYNSTTGEKLNVLEENSYDRPWYEREYIRVDFSTNLHADAYDFDTASMIGIYGSIDYEPLTYYVSDPMDEEAPYFDFEENYFDITSKMFSVPGLIDLSDLGWGIDQFPACYLDADFRGGSFPSGTCNPVEITLRSSFRRFEDNDFEPVENDGWRFQAFGPFAFAERRGFDRQYGMTDDEFRRFQSTFQIWERSHYYSDPEEMTGPVLCYTPDTTPEGLSPHRDIDNNGTEDECESVTGLTGFAGSKCDEFRQMCTLPYRARVAKPLAWYYTNGSDMRFFEATELAAHQWDSALRSAVATAKYTECMATTVGDASDGQALADARDWCNRGIDGPKVYFGQQDSNDDLAFLALEMDDCRAGKPAYADITDEIGSEERQASCAAKIDARGAAIGAEPGVIDQAKMPEMIAFCHSPVEFNDPAICAPPEERLPEGIASQTCAEARAVGDREMLETCLAARNVRLGDLRYHVANVIPEPQTPSPWGIMTSAIDPIDGQTIASCVNAWSYVNDFWAQRVVDWMRYAEGELSAEDVTEGTNIKEWSQAAQAAERGGAFQGLTRMQYQKRVAEAVGREPEELFGAKTALDSSVEINESLKNLRREFTGVMADSAKSSDMAELYRVRMNALENTWIEAELMNDMVKQLYGVDEMNMSDNVLDAVSPLRGGNIGLRREVHRLKQNALGERGMCELEVSDTPVSIVGLAKILQEKFTPFNKDDSKEAQHNRAKAMAAYIMKWGHFAVIAHEMGHAVAHRHNFVSSSDAWNYRSQYWQLRTKNGEVNAVCSTLDETGEDCVGPRFYDPVTDTEAENLIWMWQNSSVMDYAGETTQDFLGIAAWDWAATRMFYGDSAPVYHDPEATNGIVGDDPGGGMADLRDETFDKLDNFGGIIGFTYDNGNYSMLQMLYNLIDPATCVTYPDEATVAAAFKPSRWDDAVDGTWHPVLDGHIVKADGVNYSRCRQRKIDYVQWNELRVPADWANIPYMRSICPDGSCGWVEDQFGRARVPYGFATDRWADIGNAAVYRHDNGADSYEIFNWLATQQELFHIFDNYRRGRSTFTLSGATARVMDRYLGKIRDGAKGLGLQKNWMSALGTYAGVSGEALWQYGSKVWWGESLVASSMVFDHFARNFQRPSIGMHGKPTLGGLGDVGEVLRAKDGDTGYCANLWVGVDACTDAGIIPNGAYATETSAGGFAEMSPGGKVVENRLNEAEGEYSADYTLNAGSYYDKLWMAMMMTESVDNFISDSRGDFVDKRYRAVSVADLYPDGYRRWLGSNLTNDDFIKGAHIPVNGSGQPAVDENGFWEDGIGWTKWWGSSVEACFPREGTTVCEAYNSSGWPIDLGEDPAQIAPIDPEIGWEAQKYLISWTYVYLPENQESWWRDQMRMYYTPALTDDTILDDMLVFYNPNGGVYLSKRFGKEDIFGKTVEKGVSSRVLEYANSLLAKAYWTNTVDYDGDGITDWYEPVVGEDGENIVLFDPTMDGTMASSGPTQPDYCNEATDTGCTCDMNRWCVELQHYISVLDWLAAWSGFADYDTDDWNDMIGVYH